VERRLESMRQRSQSAQPIDEPSSEQAAHEVTARGASAHRAPSIDVAAPVEIPFVDPTHVASSGTNNGPAASGSMYRPLLWAQARQRSDSREDRPRQERDSLRTRSREPRPGSRKHRRWGNSLQLVDSLRRVMAATGDDDLEEDDLQPGLHENRRSAFYQLMEQEGPSGALDAWADAENASSKALPSQPREKRTSVTVAENERTVRRVFSDTWQFIHGNECAHDLLLKLEDEAVRAFGTNFQKASSEDEIAVALQWLLSWDGESLQTTDGAPPAHEMEITGLTPTQRKVAHQLARALGLHSESRDGALDEKVLALRPPRSRMCGAEAAWKPPFSVASVLVTA